GSKGRPDRGDPGQATARSAPVLRAPHGPGGPHHGGGVTVPSAGVTRPGTGNDQKTMQPDVRVVDDVAAAALDLFLEESPGTVLLTGGSTPQALYERMAELQGYPWEETEFFFSDERCVPDTDPRSNLGMAHRALLSKIPATRHPIDGANCDADGYEAMLRERFEGEPWFELA